jgi:hypothetical protein
MQIRSSGMKPEELEMETKHVKRLWESFAGDVRGAVSFEKITEYLDGVLNDFYETNYNAQGTALPEKAKATPNSTAAPSASAAPTASTATGASTSSGAATTAASSGADHNEWERTINGLNVGLVCRVIVDNMLHSLWNRSVIDVRGPAASGSLAWSSDNSSAAGESSAAGAGPSLGNQVSFSAFDEFTRQGYFASVENKLRCLFELERNAVDPAPIVLVRVYFKSTKDEIKIVVMDPYSGQYRLSSSL